MGVAARLSICLLAWVGLTVLVLVLTKHFVPEDLRTIVAGLAGYLNGQMAIVLYVLLDN